MAVPYTFAGATSSIPLSQLDTNFATTFTLGNTAIQLGNTVTTLNNMTLANVTISSGNVTITNVSVTTANVTTGNVTTLTSTNATLTNMSSGNVTITGGTINGTSLGASTASTANVTTLTTSSTVTLNGGTANGVAYLDGSKVLTTGSALTFDGANAVSMGSGGSANTATSLTLNATDNAANGSFIRGTRNGANAWLIGDTSASLGTGTGFTSYNYGTAPWIWFLQTGGEQMRLTSTGLGIGTSSPAVKLQVAGDGRFTGTFPALTLLRTDSTSPAARIRMVGSDNADKWEIATNYLVGGAGLEFNYAGSNLAFLSNSGNLGLGVTPSAWNTGKVLQIGSAHYFGDNGQAITTQNAYYNSQWLYQNNAQASRYEQAAGIHAWYTAPSGTAGNAISFTQALTLDASGNLLLGGTTAGASSAASLAIFNGTAPTGSVTNGIILYAEDVSSSSELKVRDEAGNVTTLSPHNFSLIPDGPSEDMAWAYYSEKGGKRINVDMLKLARMVEKLTGEKLVYES